MDDQYRIIASGSGWTDRTPRGRLSFVGKDAIAFLQALVTNDVAHLSKGSGVYAAYLTPQGRMTADIEILHRGEWLFGSVAEGLGPALAARFDSLIFSEDLRVTDVSGDWAEIGVTGRDAADVLGQVFDRDPHRLMALGELAQEDLEGGFMVRSDESPFPMFRVVAPAAERQVMVARLEAAGAIPMSSELVTALRIESGRPAWGTDLTAETIPLEAGLLDRAISTTKGCYVGQEIVIRILHRAGGRVAKRLVTIAFDPAGPGLPAAGSSIIVDGKDVGHLTSVAFSPARARVMAFGYVHRDATEIGRSVTVDGVPGEIERFAR